MRENRDLETPIEHEPVSSGIVGRSKALWIILILVMSALLLRVLLLQTVDYDRYQKKVIEQMTTESEVRAKRGNIYDANGVAIATNITTYRVFISPSSIAEEQSEINQNGEDIQLAQMISEKLSKLLNVSYDFVLAETHLLIAQW